MVCIKQGMIMIVTYVKEQYLQVLNIGVQVILHYVIIVIKPILIDIEKHNIIQRNKEK